MAGLTLDTGALIAADKDDPRLWLYVRIAGSRGVVPTIPAAALAQAWRGPRSARLAQLLAACEVEPLDESLAKKTGLILARSVTTNVVDASVVAGAHLRGDQILTTDPNDLRRLAAGGVDVIDLRLLSQKRPLKRSRRKR